MSDERSRGSEAPESKRLKTDSGVDTVSHVQTNSEFNELFGGDDA
jgi:hypothetical protein